MNAKHGDEVKCDKVRVAALAFLTYSVSAILAFLLFLDTFPQSVVVEIH